jgi:hypothetical protein
MNAIVIIVAVLFAVMGVAALLRPAVIWAPFGIEPTTPGARSEVRAVYGGFGLAIAAILLYAENLFGGGVSAGVRDGILLTAAASLLGMAAGRVVSALVEPKTLLSWPGFFLVVEVAGAALLCLAR